MIGLAGVVVWSTYCAITGFSGEAAALIILLAAGIPMMLWSILIDKVHRNPSTGIDWDSPPKPVRDVLDTAMTKLAGLWATWAIIAAIYCIFRFYWKPPYLFSIKLFTAGASPLFFIYVIWLERRLKEPRDGAWHFGAMLMGLPGWDKEAIFHHLRAWAVKGFFTAFMFAILPGNFNAVVTAQMSEVLQSPMSLAKWLIGAMFLIDVGTAMVGYLLTLKPFDAHIRTANPYMVGWVAALLCYPPFVLMGSGGLLDYQQQTAGWEHWLEGADPFIRNMYGLVLVILTGIYAWATVAFGLRFSNLTNRGIITNGPYAWTKHPAYVAKNTFWWLEVLPVLVLNGNPVDAIRNTAIMALVSGIYFWRAKTEEKHLMADPDYQSYAAWMAQYSPMARMIRRVKAVLIPTRARAVVPRASGQA